MSNRLPSPEEVFRQMPCLCGVLQIAARSAARLYSEEMHHTGLEVTQNSMLKVLNGLGPMTLGELGERLCVDKTTASRNVKILERNGWVVLERGEDARERIVSLTREGEKKLASAHRAWERAQARMKTALPDGRFEALKQALADLAVTTLKA